MPRRKEWIFQRRAYETDLGFFPEGGFLFMRYKKAKGKDSNIKARGWFMPTFKELNIRRRK